MACHPWKLDRSTSLTSAVIVPLCLMLSACGGGGGSSQPESIPPPPPPPAPPPPPPPPSGLVTTISGYSLVNSLDVQTSWLPSPATRAGNYDVIGRLTLTPGSGNPTSYRTILPGDLTFKVSGSGSGGFGYSLDGLGGILPNGLESLGPASIVGSWDINQNIAYLNANPYGGDYPQALGQRLTAFDQADNGTETKLFSYDYTRGSISSTTSLGSGKNLSTTFDYDIGYSYVAMGEWSWRVVDLDGTAAGDFGDLLFVDGDRTPASGIPVSGKATYDAHTLALLSSSGSPGIPFTLTADFDQRTISTLISQDYRYNSSGGASGDPILGIHVSGSSPFSNDGLFDIALSGTVNYSHSNSQATPAAESVTGDMNGAFFGPHAEQVGGVFDLGRPDGTLLVQDAFVGRQK